MSQRGRRGKRWLLWELARENNERPLSLALASSHFSNFFRLASSNTSSFPFVLGNARMRVLGSRAPLRRLLEELLVCSPSPSSSTKLAGFRARAVSAPSTSSSASSASSLCCYANGPCSSAAAAAAASRLSTSTTRHASSTRRSRYNNSNSVTFFKVATAAASSPPPPPSSSSISSHSFGMQSRARVYADANVDRPREYWDYEALTVEWG